MSRKTYEIEHRGPYEEDEAREKIRAYCDEHGFFAASTLTVVEMTDDVGHVETSSRRCSVSRRTLALLGSRGSRETVTAAVVLPI